MYKYIIVESDCQFDLGYYPFDHQNCQISLAYQGNQGEIIKLIEGNLVYLGPTTMKQYEINKIEFESNQDNKIKVAIKFSRNILRELLTIIFPTILIVIVSILSCYAIIELNFLTILLIFRLHLLQTTSLKNILKAL